MFVNILKVKCNPNFKHKIFFFQFLLRILNKNTRNDVLIKDSDVSVTVTAVLLMMKPESMKEFVLNNRVIDTPRTLERNNLSLTLAAQI